MTKKKQPYFHNNWKLYKESPDEFFLAHEFDDFMNWKVAGWELPSSVCCIIRESDQKTKQVKEHVYTKHQFAVRKINKLMKEGKEFTIVDAYQVNQMYPD